MHTSHSLPKAMPHKLLVVQRLLSSRLPNRHASLRRTRSGMAQRSVQTKEEGHRLSFAGNQERQEQRRCHLSAVLCLCLTFL